MFESEFGSVQCAGAIRSAVWLLRAALCLCVRVGEFRFVGGGITAGSVSAG